MQENLDRFKAKRKMAEKSTQYYYYTDDIMNSTDTAVSDWVNHWIYNEGPGSDQRYRPELATAEYFALMTDEEKERMIDEYNKKFKVLEEEEGDEPEEMEIPRKVKLVPGTLVLIQNFGKDDEPRKYMWNNAKGEILKKNPDGTFKVRITDVKDSDVLYSKNWYNGEHKAMRQRLNLTADEFIPLKDIADAEKSETLIDGKSEVKQKSDNYLTRRFNI